jgi:hypothetical protein
MPVTRDQLPKIWLDKVAAMLRFEKKRDVK